jgi:hypothetical protein
MVGAGGGVVAGQVEIAFGPRFPSWVGDKYDTLGLGIATTGLSVIALAVAALLSTKWAAAPVRRLAMILGMLAPALVGFTTAGKLWWVPGSMLCASAVLGGWTLRQATSEIAESALRRWPDVLLFVLGLYLLAIGSTSVGAHGLVGCAGGLTVMTVAIADRRAPATVAIVALAVLPYAWLTWWSLVTPTIALLAVSIAATGAERSTRNGDRSRMRSLVHAVGDLRSLDADSDGEPAPGDRRKPNACTL